MKLHADKACTLLSVCSVPIIKQLDLEVLNCGPRDSLETKQKKRNISNIQLEFNKEYWEFQRRIARLN